jgi:hypothetical protein
MKSPAHRMSAGTGKSSATSIPSTASASAGLSILKPAAWSYRKRKEGGLVLAAKLQIGDELASTLLEGFRLPIQAIFE